MSVKHQSECYRILKGIRYTNYADLIMSEEENLAVIAKARAEYVHVARRKHPDGYEQVFVAHPKLFRAKIINLGRGRVNKDIFFNDTKELHKVIDKHVASKGWGMDETEIEGTWEVTAGYRTIGTVIITAVTALNH